MMIQPHGLILAFMLLPIIHSPANAATPLPSRVDNRTTPYFPPIISQVGESCASANGVGYIFNYEINAARNTPVADSANQYPYFGTYNFLNDGSEEKGTHLMFVDAWKIIRDNGIANAIDFGSIQPGSTQWLNGYDNYYRAMHNRVAAIDSINLLAPGSITRIKQWLFDHGNGSPSGGILTITASAWGVQDDTISTGPGKGLYILRRFGTNPTSGPHALAVVGYDDSIRYDDNNDGKFTTDVDINGDRQINEADNEFGAFICANTWGLSSGNSGCIYVPYRKFLETYVKGGLLSNTAWTITVRKHYRPLRTFKISLSHPRRNMIALSVGIAADSTATVPVHIRPLRQFARSGGGLPMCGANASSTIELGLDISDLIDSIQSPAGTATYFLMVDADDKSGSINALSLMDYSEALPVEYRQTALPATLWQGSNIYRIAAPLPAIGIGSPETSQYSPLTRLTTRRFGKYLQLQIPTGTGHIEIFSVNGRRLVSCGTRHGDSWYTIPTGVAPGIVMIRLTMPEGEQRFGVLQARLRH